jgi:hypothetical protein
VAELRELGGDLGCVQRAAAAGNGRALPADHGRLGRLQSLNRTHQASVYRLGLTAAD